MWQRDRKTHKHINMVSEVGTNNLGCTEGCFCSPLSMLAEFTVGLNLSWPVAACFNKISKVTIQL